MQYNRIIGTKAEDLPPLIGPIPDTQLVIVPDPVTGELFRSTFGQVKTDIVAAFGGISFLDPIVEVATIALLPNPGAIKTLYVITTGADANRLFRWGGTMYIEFSNIGGDVTGEAAIRAANDAILQGNIDAETAARITADGLLQTNINTEATQRSNGDILAANNLAAEANTRANNDAILLGLINAEGAIRATNDNLKVDKIAGYGLSQENYTTAEKAKLAGLESSHFKGKFINLVALNAALPTATVGDYAHVDAGTGADVVEYIWDDSDDVWILQTGASTAETAASIKTKYESNADTNAYTDAEKSKLSGLSNYDDTTLSAAVANKVDKNIAITGATKTKVTYDAKGLVTAGDDATQDDIGDGITYKQYSATEKTKLAGIVKATAAELNAGTDDAKFATAAGLESSKYLNQSGAKISATASGTDIYAATISPAITAYSATQRFFIKFTNANTGAATLNLNTIGAIPIVKQGATALSAGDIKAGQIMCVAYDGTNFQIVGDGGGSGGASDNYATATGTNTYAAAITGITAYVAGMSIRIKFTNANTGASTMNVNSLGAINIYKGASTALTAGTITSGQIFELYYDGAAFQIGSAQVIPTAANMVITTSATGVLQAVNNLMDYLSTTTEATLLAQDWTPGYVTAPGNAGQKVFGASYEFTCTGTNTWRRSPYNLVWNDLYLANVSDSGGVKTSTYMAANYATAAQGQRVRGANGVYEYFGLFGWVYFPFTII